MNDTERLRAAVPCLLMVVLGLMVILLPMWARTLGILLTVTGSCGLVWACWGTGISGRVRAQISRRRARSASSEPFTIDVDHWLQYMKRERARSASPAPPTQEIGPIDTWIVLGVPCKKEIYDEMVREVAEGLRLAQVPGRPEDPRILVDGPHGYCTSLEKPSEL